MNLILPGPNGAAPYACTGTPVLPKAPQGPLGRVAFAAAHVVADPAAGQWDGAPVVDWESTLRVRHDLWDQGLHLAEAMDTAQRGMGVPWKTARALIDRTMAEAKAHPSKPRVACGAGTDHAAPATLEEVRAAYLAQMEAIEAAGGEVILMASPALPALGAGPEDYARLYADLIAQAAQPVILHWLGEMFLPALRGYWGSEDHVTASDTVLSIIGDGAGVDGIKISLLDAGKEEAFRTRLPQGVRLYTGDDFNYPDLIAGDGTHHSDALLGIFAAISPAAAQGLAALGRGDIATYRALMDPTVPLARHLFGAPTQHYKTGIALLAWLNGLQPAFAMPGGMEAARGTLHLAETFRLADACGMLRDPDLATARMGALMAVRGVAQG